VKGNDMNPDSKKFSFNWSDFLSLGRNAILVGLAASLTYMGENIGDVDMGTSGVLMVPLVAVLIDAAVKWSKDNTK
tara:strand:- start:870 stop:1097 length:228 start_codon:yes stop_codon:yes gene_type:complete